MVFESIVVDLLNRTIGDYVKNLDKSQLKLGIWGGDVVLDNLELKENALDELNLPVKSTYGSLGKLCLKIPWKNLYTEPVIATIESLYVLVIPNLGIKYDAEKEAKFAQEAKQKELQLIEEAKKREAEKNKPKPEQNDSFSEKLVAQVIKNLQVTIKEIHVRYEDRYSNPGRPFAAGLTLQNLTFQSTDEHWKPCVVKDAVKMIFKLVQLNNLAIYWNCNTIMYSSFGKQQMMNSFKRHIATHESTPGDFAYVLRPINSSARLRLNMKPENDGSNFQNSKVVLNLEMQELALSLSKKQYQDVMELLESFERMSFSAKYRKYKINIDTPKQGHAKIWWKFAYSCILEEEVKRNSYNWSWKHMKDHRNKLKAYKEAYRKKLMSRKIPGDVQLQLDSLEKDLDTFNILLVRQQAEVEVDRRGLRASDSTEGGGWFGGWFGGKKKPEKDKESLTKKFEEAMTLEEKSKLFEAIDYQENQVFTDYPVEFVENDLHFMLHNLSITIKDDSKSHDVQVMKIVLKHVSSKVQQRPAAKAVKFEARVGKLHMYGSPRQGLTPQMISSPGLEREQKGVDTQVLLSILFETNPLDRTCDQRVNVESSPLEIIYDANTVNQLADVFRPPESVQLKQLTAAALSTFEEIKERSATGLSHAIEQHKTMDLNINLQASYIIIPETGAYEGKVHLLVLDLGNLQMKSVLDSSIPGSPKSPVSLKSPSIDSIKELMERSYEKYQIELQAFQVIFASPGEDWKNARNQSKSPMHLLQPTKFQVQFHKSIIQNDPRMPKMRIVAHLPNIAFNISDYRLQQLVNLGLSIPVPEIPPAPQDPFSSNEPLPTNLHHRVVMKNISMISCSLQEEESEMSVNIISAEPVISSLPKQDLISTPCVNFIEMEASFEINELCLNLYRMENKKEVPTLHFNLRTMGTQVLMRTFDMGVEVFIGSISLEHPQYKDNRCLPIQLIKTPKPDEASKLLIFKYINAKKNSPDFETKYKSTEQDITVKLSGVHVLLHQEAILDIKELLDSFQAGLEQMEEKRKKFDSTPQILTVPKASDATAIQTTKVRSLKKVIPNPNEIAIKIDAHLEGLGVTIAACQKKLSVISIQGLDAGVIIQHHKTTVMSGLKDIVIEDPLPSSVYPQILTTVGDEVLKFKLDLYNNATEGDNYLNMDVVDTSVELYIGGIRLVFLNRFVNELLSFLDHFQSTKEKLKEASAAATEAALKSMEDIYVKATRVSLNIQMKAPEIVIPQCSNNPNALIADLGFLTLSNQFMLSNKKNELGQPAMFDRLKIELTALQLSRVIIAPRTDTALSECLLIEPVSVTLDLTRNLTISWYKDVPELDVVGKLATISITMSQEDYNILMSVLNDNFGEVSATTPSKSEDVVSKKASVLPVETSQEVKATVELLESKPQLPPQSPKLYKRVKFAFQMDSLQASLFKGSSNLSSEAAGPFQPKGIVQRNYQQSLGRFELFVIAVKGEIFSDNSLLANLLLVNCVLDDTREDHMEGITRMMERPEKYSDSRNSNMIDFTFRQESSGDKFVDIRIHSFYVCVCMDFLMSLADFFVVPSPAVAPQSSKLLSTTEINKAAVVEPVRPTSSMAIQLKIEQPEIVLVENSDDENTKALIMNMEIMFKMKTTPDLQNMMGNIKSLQIFSCTFKEELRGDSTAQILIPCDIDLVLNMPFNQGQHIDINVSDFILNISPDTIKTMVVILGTFGKQPTEEELKKASITPDYSDLWAVKKLNDCDLWYINTVSEALDVVSLPSLEVADQSSVRGDQLIMECATAVITLEANVGQRNVPMILVETCFNAIVKDWSSQLSINSTLSMEVAYYNEKLVMWEPLIEPVEQGGTHRPWDLTFEVTKNDEILPVGAEEEVLFLPPVMSIIIKSDDILQMTVSKTCLEVLSNLGKAFGEAVNQIEPEQKKEEVISNYLFQNDIGIPLTIILDQSFQIPAKEKTHSVALPPGSQLNINLSEHQTSRKSVLHQQDIEDAIKVLVQVDEANTAKQLGVTKVQKRFYQLPNWMGTSEPWGFVSQVEASYGFKKVILRSHVQVYNHCNIPIEVYYKSDEKKLCGTINPNSIFNIPAHAVYTTTTELYFRPTIGKYDLSTNAFVWKLLTADPTFSSVMQCSSQQGGHEAFFINAQGEMDWVMFEESTKKTLASTCFIINLYPTVTFHNLLPRPITVFLPGTVEELKFEGGEKFPIYNACLVKSQLKVTISNYLNKEWSCQIPIDPKFNELTAWTFEAKNDKKNILDLGLHSINKKGSLQMSLYCPYWMINKTGIELSYKGSDDPLTVINHPANFNDAILYSFKPKSFFTKKKALLKVTDSDWSDKFPIDVVGSSGTVSCKSKDKTYEIGVDIKLTTSGLTKIVIFLPYFTIVNNTKFDINVIEDAEDAFWLEVPIGQCKPFWPKSNKNHLMKIRIKDHEEETAFFWYNKQHTTLLQLNNEKGGISVDCHVSEASIVITMEEYNSGMAAVRIVNCIDKLAIEYSQSGSKLTQKLGPMETVLYTWENPSGKRELIWSCGEKKQQKDDLIKDGIGDFFADHKNDLKVYWVTFLDGAQRVLMFTEDIALAAMAQEAGELERVEQEITLSLKGLGLSLVDNFNKTEVVYMGITSTGIIWEMKKDNKRYRPTSLKECSVLETAFQKYSNEKAVGKKPNSRQVLEGKLEVDFEEMTMLKPNKRHLRRSFQTGVWLQYKTSPHQTQLHAKINHLQIDNQLPLCVFSTVLAPIPPPKSVAAESVPKPFTEISLMMRKAEHSSLQQIKYFKVLIQEMHLKVDQGFINAMINFFTPEGGAQGNELELFAKDKGEIHRELLETAAYTASQEHKNFYDILHFSPLKVHISFSMQGVPAESGNNKKPTQIQADFINLLLQSVGVTLTEIQDVVFKLAYFERQHHFMSQKQLTSEVTSHYSSQAIKQMYVLVLGLDVLGNPFGLIRGLQEGVTDLFYEPYQGIIQGPEEFAEGLALGVRSLFGHAVGGAAGAVSRITGTLGKGIAALTMDDEYQRKRQEILNRRPANVREGFAQSGKGLIMGVFDGVTGIVRKPIEGAKEEGVEGFVKGVGKGLIGVVTRPTAGVIDFASGSFDAVKRAAEMSDEVRRLRPPRFIYPDAIIRPYSQHEAEGNQILQEVEKGKYAHTDIYHSHVVITNDGKVIFLITDNRLILVSRGDIFGHWDCEWQFTWSELKEVPTLEEKGIKVLLKEQKKKVLGIFGSTSAGKLVHITNKKTAQWILGKITEVMTKAK